VALRAFLKIFTIAAAGLLCAAAEPLTKDAFVPVFRENFPDPFVLQHGGQFIAYATNEGANVPVATSPDLVNWSFVADPADPRKRRDAMPTLAPWAKTGFTWAPEVLKVGDKYILYYTANHPKRDVQCIGAAVASDPLGPFVDTSQQPLVCQFDLGGSIDAAPFRDADGKLYLYWKSDGNRIGKRTRIWGQQLSTDGMSLLGTPVALVQDDAEWEWRLVEAPAMVRSPGGYQLFYSAAFFGWDEKERLSRYATGYANCSGPLGPCKDAPENPILHSFYDRTAGCLSGPGHPAIFQVGNRSFMAFHAWAATKACRKAEDKRYLYIAPIFWKDGKPQIAPSLRATASAERG